MDYPKKSLGQHWLKDEATLEAIVKGAGISAKDTVLEIGPGQGTLTAQLLKRTQKVIAVEVDPTLAKNLMLQGSALQHKGKLEVVEGDILEFDLGSLPRGYKVVANIPYYLTSKLLRTLSESQNPPSSMALLVQKEVAQRICASPGSMSLLAVSVQLYYECALGQVIPSEMFIPPPKVDSQVVHLQRRSKPIFPGWHPGNKETENFFRIIKAGFSGRRKMLRSSLSGGLGLSKEKSDELLKKANIDGNRRAQELSLEDWYTLSRVF